VDILQVQLGATEEYNGSTWANNPTGLGYCKKRYSLAGAGIETAALVFGGFTTVQYRMQLKSMMEVLGLHLEI
jgi:hypothetical protein